MQLLVSFSSSSRLVLIGLGLDKLLRDQRGREGGTRVGANAGGGLDRCCATERVLNTSQG